MEFRVFSAPHSLRLCYAGVGFCLVALFRCGVLADALGVFNFDRLVFLISAKFAQLQ